MQRHLPILITAVKTDRSRGLSISELMKKYSLPKTTVWHYIHDVKLSDAARFRIRSLQGGSIKRSKDNWKKAETQAAFLMKHFKEDTMWPILFTALYWSEGTKRSGFVFTNTDASMIRIFLKILRERIGIKNEDLNILVRTCTPMNQSICRNYWAKVTRVSMGEIKINHDNKQNKSKTKYGMCRITVKKGGKYLKLVHCLIQELTAKMLIVT